MGADLQTFMARRGAKTLGLVLLLSCLGFFLNVYIHNPHTSNFRRALFFKNSSLLEQDENQISWSDGNGKFVYVCIPMTLLTNKNF